MSEVICNFDRKSVVKAINRSAPTTLSRAGAYLRAIAKNSIKTRKNPDASSTPGTPPHHHSTFKNTIRWALSPAEKAVYVGPELMRSGMNNVGKLHEFGGTVQLPPRRKKFYRVGEVGPIKGTNRKNAVYIRLRTALQVAKADAVAESIYPWLAGGTKRYPARPFMRPALLAGLPKLSRFWNNAIKP